MEKKEAIICDIDWTIADCTHRLHHLQKEPKDWDSFYNECIKDFPINDVIQIIKSLSDYYEIIFVSWRRQGTWFDTWYWLYNNWLVSWIYSKFENWNFTQKKRKLLLREDWDHRQDYEVKKELYYKYIEPKYKVIWVFEDRKQCVDMYRELWLTVFQVKDWDY